MKSGEVTVKSGEVTSEKIPDSGSNPKRPFPRFEKLGAHVKKLTTERAHSLEVIVASGRGTQALPGSTPKSLGCSDCFCEKAYKEASPFVEVILGMSVVVASPFV